jgi:MSHA biogenesis protein MshG
MSVLMYKYQALDASGSKTSGTLRAASEQEAYRKINAQGLTPVSLDVVRGASAGFSFQRIKSQDIVNFTRELAVLVEARIPLDRGLLSIAEHETNRPLAAMIRDVATQIESGVPITQALAKYQDVFGGVYVSTMRAAEKSGNLQAVTQHLAEMLEKQVETRQQIVRAMTYPIIVLCMIAAAMSVIIGFVVPKFARTFAASGGQLPLATRVVQALGNNVHDYWWAYAGALAVAIVGWIIAWRNPTGRLALERFLTRVPYIGRVLIAHASARFARVMGIGLASGLDVIESMQVAGHATGRPVFASDCDAMAQRLRSGERLADVLSVTRYLPPFARRMIGAGKDSKEVSRACDIVARHYDREAGNLTKNINTIVEPIMTVGLAAIVLVVALAVFLPMWQMARIKR